jgi:hypothetical protein
MDEQAIARAVAVLCATMLEASFGDPKSKDHHTRAIAMADNYLDFICPHKLRVSSKGEVSFEPD